jgi:hypothetical protein
MGRRKAVIVGAGALGLGFLAERLVGDYEMWLADVAAKSDLLGMIEARQGFTANVCGLDRMKARWVGGAFHAVFTDTPGGRQAFATALQGADLVLTATGLRLLDRIVPEMAPTLNARDRRAWLLFCENGRRIAEDFTSRLGPLVVPVNTVMSRMCRFADPDETKYEPLWPGHPGRLVVEDYALLPLDADLCGGGPFSDAFTLVTPAQFHCWEDIKRYLHNGMHAYVAYHACLQGVRRFPQTPEPIRAAAREVMLTEVIPALVT